MTKIQAEIVLRELLDKRGLMQKDLSDMANIRPSAVSNLVRGYVDRVDLGHISRIASALGVTDMNEIIKLVEYKEEGDAN